MDNPRYDVLITRGQKQAVFPQKLAVGAQLSKLVGWDRPTEVRVEAGTELAAFLGGLFAAGGALGGSNSSNGERSQETSVRLLLLYAAECRHLPRGVLLRKCRSYR